LMYDRTSRFAFNISCISSFSRPLPTP
jgi:hypothetical protein